MSTLLEYRLDGTHDIVADAIADIRERAKFKICLRFSGGKDSIVSKRLLDMAGVDYEARFSLTSVDPPELVQYIRKYHPDVIIERPKTFMKALIVKKGFPPTRVCRFCCSEFKERNTCPKMADGRLVYTATGVRWKESKRRSKRRKVEGCYRTKNVLFYHPIIEWEDQQVWDFISLEHLPYCSLYDEGFERIGCVGCPLSSSKSILREFQRWPGFERMYMSAFEEMLVGRNFDKWKNASDVMNWYIYGSQATYEQIEGQMEFDDYTSLYSEDYYGQLDNDHDIFSEHDDEYDAQRLKRFFHVA